MFYHYCQKTYEFIGFCASSNNNINNSSRQKPYEFIGFCDSSNSNNNNRRH